MCIYRYMYTTIDVHTLRMTYYVETQVNNFTMNKIMTIHAMYEPYI